MPKKPKRKLTLKQDAVITDVIRSVKEGEKFSLAESVGRIYNVSKKSSAASIATQLGNNKDFRETLLNALEERRIIGANSRVEEVLSQGLDAEDKNGVDFRTRLEYAKEINKIAGVYAPEKHESKKMTLNLNMTEEELSEKLKSLQEELNEI